MKKGFATTGILYAILIIGLIFMVSLLVDLQNKRTVLDNIKKETEDAVDTKLSCGYLDEELTTANNKYNTLSNTYIELMKQLNQTDADKSEVFDGKKVYSKGSLITGIMPNNGDLISSIKAGESYIVPLGYTSGGKISAATLASQTLASAQAKNIVEGYTGWVNGILITGTDKGYDVGYSDGNAKGYNDGHTSGYNKGQTDGYNQGQNEGYTSGYNAALSTATMQTASWSASYRDGSNDDSTKVGIANVYIGPGMRYVYAGMTSLGTAGDTDGSGSGYITYSYNSSNGYVTIYYYSGRNWVYVTASASGYVIYMK